MSKASNNMGERIRHLRVHKDWLQKELAYKTGFSAQKISNIERNYNKEISSDDVAILARVFDVTADFILSGATSEIKIRQALNNDEELLIFFNELCKRDDLRLLFNQVKPLGSETIKRIIKYIKMVEDEENA